MGSMSLPSPLPAGKPWTVLGLVPGTSAEGADAAAIRMDPAGFCAGSPFLDFLGHRHEPYPAALRQAVLAADRHRRVLLELSMRLPGLRLEEDLAFPPGAREAVSWVPG